MPVSLRFSFAIALVLSVAGLHGTGWSDGRASGIRTPGEGRNLAFNKPYTVNRRPDYGVATDSEHAQLTNGIYTQGLFWAQSTTVGWTRANVQPVVITIDLGTVESIGGASYSTAAGRAGVHWPQNVFVLTSEDASTWFLAGDLVSLDRTISASPPPDAYGTHRFSTTRLVTRGRYVAFVVESDFYIFCDEIEVFSGAAFPPRPQGRQVSDPLAFHWNGSQLVGWIDTVSKRLSRLPEAVRRPLLLAGPIDKLRATFTPKVSLGDRLARPAVPYTREQEEVFTLNGRALQAGGTPPVEVWKLHRYDPLDPIQSPSADSAPALTVECMNGERRADAIVLTNATGEPQRVHIQVTGLPGGPNPAYVSASEVQFVGTASRFLAASALQETARAAGDFVVTIPAGVNRQLWFSVQPTDLPPGVHQGTVSFRSERDGAVVQKVPFTLRVSPVRFPVRPKMHLGGWDYTNGSGTNSVTAANRAPLVHYLQSHYVDTPWATSSVLGRSTAGDFTADCGLRRELDFSELDDWGTRWRSARLFLVFLNGGGDFAGHAAGTSEFRRCVGSWLTAVAARLRQNGVNPSQFGLLLVDEPITDAEAARVTAWADAVHEAGTGIFVWENPQFRGTARDPAAAVVSATDVVSPLVSQYLAMDPDGRRTARQSRGTPKRFWLYNTTGPAHSLDPYAYYQLHFWLSFREGAEGAGFWSFSDAGGGNAWDESASPRIVDTPEYLAPDGVTDSKQMMAIVEGIEDFEYLGLLRDRLAKRGSGDTSAAVRAAAKLLTDAPDSVLAALISSHAPNYEWATPRDRSLADRMRTRVLRALEALAQGERP